MPNDLSLLHKTAELYSDLRFYFIEACGSQFIALSLGQRCKLFFLVCRLRALSSVHNIAQIGNVLPIPTQDV